MCNQICFSVDTFTFLYDDDDDDDDDNDDEHYPILTHKNLYMGKSAYGNLGQCHDDDDDDDDAGEKCYQNANGGKLLKSKHIENKPARLRWGSHWRRHFDIFPPCWFRQY